MKRSKHIILLSLLFTMSGCYYSGGAGLVESAPIGVNPNAATSSAGYPVQFHPYGGEGPYSYAVISGPGSIDQNAGVFYPDGISRGLTEISISDKWGAKTKAKVYSFPIFTNQSILAFAQNGNDLYLGGNFTQVTTAFSAPGMLSLESTTGDPIQSCNFQEGFNGIVYTILTFDDSIFVGGAFTSYRGVAVGNLVKLDSKCNLDTTFTQVGNGFDSSVLALLVDSTNSSLYVGGAFTQYRGVANNVQRLAKLDLLSGNLDTTFSLPNNGFNSAVRTLVVDPTTNSLYVGGAFTQYRGVVNNAKYLAKLDRTTGSLDTAFTQANNGFDLDVYSIVKNKTTNSLYVGGHFSKYRGVANNAKGLAKIDLTTGNLDTIFTQANNGFDSTVSIIEMNIQSNALYVGGQFTQYRGVANNAQRLAKIDLTTGNLDTAFTQPNNGFNTLQVSTLLMDGSTNSLFVGGNFSQYRGVANNAKNFAKLDLTTGNLDTSFTHQNSGFNNSVYSISMNQSDKSLYIGGFFNQYRGNANNAQSLAKIDLKTGFLDTSFTQAGSGFGGVTNPTVNALALNTSNNSLYAGGKFSSYRGIANNAQSLAKIDLTTGILDTNFTHASAGFSGGTNGEVDSLAINNLNSSIYVGGDFTQYGGTANNAQYLAKLDLTSGNLDSAFTQANNGLNNVVRALALFDINNSIYVGGDFTQYRGVANNSQRLAKLDITTGNLDTVFTQASSGFNNTVRAIGVNPANNSLYVGGAFNQYRGVANNALALAKLDLNSGVLDTAFTQASNGFSTMFPPATITALAINSPNNSIYVGGIFNSYRSVTNNAQSLAKLDLTNGNLDTNFTPPNCGITYLYSLSVSSTDNSLFVGGDFFTYRNYSTPYFINVNLDTGNPK